MRREVRHLSFVLNVVLAATVVALVVHRSERAPDASFRESSADEKTQEILPAIESHVAITQPRLQQCGDFASATDRRRWIVDQLRAAGVPDHLIAQVVRSDLEEEWNRRVEDGAARSRGNADTMAALHLEREQDEEAAMRAALGNEGFKLWDEAHLLREANIGKIPLTDAETNAIYDLKKKLQQRVRELDEARLKGTMDDMEINDATDKAYSEFNGQMKTLLGDDRYAKSQGLDEGAAAANLRQDLAEANPSDSQFQSLLKAQQDWNDSRSALDRQFQDDPSNPAYTAQLSALDAARDAEYQRVLGTKAFDSLQKEQDAGYSKMKKYENIWGLDDSSVDRVYAGMKYYQQSALDYEARAKALEAQGQSVDWNAINQDLQQFAIQTRQTIQDYLGQDKFNRLQQNGVFQFNQSPRQTPFP